MKTKTQNQMRNMNKNKLWQFSDIMIIIIIGIYS